MEMGVYVKQMLAHFVGMLDKANLDKGAHFLAHRTIWYGNLYSAGHKTEFLLWSLFKLI